MTTEPELEVGRVCGIRLFAMLISLSSVASDFFS